MTRFRRFLALVFCRDNQMTIISETVLFVSSSNFSAVSVLRTDMNLSKLYDGIIHEG